MPRRASPPVQPPGGAPRPTEPSRLQVPAELDRRPADGVLRALRSISWAEARKLVQTGKVRVSGELLCDPARRLRAGDLLEVDVRAPRPRVARVREAERDLCVYIDPAVVVVRKPAGISTVPYGDDPEDTLDALVREVLARRDRVRGRAPLGVVQRLDKQTTGLLVFTRTFAAKKDLTQQLRQRTVGRVYLAIAHGQVRKTTYRSLLAVDRGDGLRGSRAARPGRPARDDAGSQLAVTHVEPVEPLAGATLVRCRLETGRTHQIRIHLAEAGHPLLGEEVYVRNFAGTRIPAPRVMLHAAELSFDHPRDGRRMRFEEPLPKDFEETLQRLRR